jgi:SAM-dependent methyltransferase
VWCPNCHSLGRQRLFKLWFDANRDLISGKSVLHFAPEKSVVSFIKPVAKRYVTADLMRPGVNINMNIENIDLDEKFDVIIASHVLEHVVYDRKAFASIHRTLVPKGLLLAMVPIVENIDTFEDRAITSPKDRQLYFGQYDHVRYYGGDFVQRITDAGFTVKRFTAVEPSISKFSLNRGETVFVCSKE